MYKIGAPSAPEEQKTLSNTTYQPTYQPTKMPKVSPRVTRTPGHHCLRCQLRQIQAMATLLPMVPQPRHTSSSRAENLLNWHIHFNFLIGRTLSEYRVPQSFIHSRAGAKFHTYCQRTAEQRADQRVHLKDVSEPVFAVFLRVLKGGSPPPTPRGWMSAAWQPGSPGLDWDAVVRKSVGEWAVELYAFAREHDIQLLSRRTRQWVMQAVDPQCTDSVPAIAVAMEKLVREDQVFSLTPEDKLLRALVGAYTEKWMVIPWETKVQLPNRFVQMILRAVTGPEGVWIVTHDRRGTGKVRICEEPWEGLPETSAAPREYDLRQRYCMQRNWKNNEELVRL